MGEHKTDQEKFWTGQFGDDYINRNPENFEMMSRMALFVKILSRTTSIQSVIEFGANIGNNLKVIKSMRPEAELSAVEINQAAVKELEKWGAAKVYHQSIFDFRPDRQCDLAFVSGVLIHLNPDMLLEAYNLLFQASKRYIAVIEYYNPTPVEIPYRGHDEKLFKRDFAGEMLDRFEGKMQLLDYGFVYHRDNNFPLDDLTWFLLEKR